MNLSLTEGHGTSIVVGFMQVLTHKHTRKEKVTDSGRERRRVAVPATLNAVPTVTTQSGLWVDINAKPNNEER